MTDLSIGITAHAEGIILHKTLLSIEAAVEPLKNASITYEILLQLDNPTQQTNKYIQRSKDIINRLGVSITESFYGNPSQSRNAIVQRAKGHYITFLDADDLISSNWLLDAHTSLVQHAATGSKFVAHPEYVLEFGDTQSVIIRHGEIDRPTDLLLSTYANRWNVVMMIERSFLLENPYPYGAGYGFEDWYINCLTIDAGYHNILVPETVLFVRRKTEDSVWLSDQHNHKVLPANNAFLFSTIRSLTQAPKSLGQAPFKQSLKQLLKNSRMGRKSYFLSKQLLAKLRNSSDFKIPGWLIEEQKKQHQIEKTIFPTSSPAIYDSLTPEHTQAAQNYKTIADSLSFNTYNYILFVPWIIKGGADLFAVNYANSIAKASPEKRVLVISTVASESPWKDKLDDNVGFLDFGTITASSAPAVSARLLEHVIENSQATHLHVLNSEVGYEFIQKHVSYIRATNKKVIATSFSQSTDETNRVFGYSHTHVPYIYEMLSALTTDNQPVKDMWVQEYGFNSDDIFVHNQPVALPKEKVNYKKSASKSHLDILWAARLSPEKQPKILKDIAEKLSGEPVHFHIFGQADEGFDTSFLQTLPSNTTYHGPFNGFASLHPETYDMYLYTSLFDGMPNSVLEAASYGLPIIASSVGGVPDFIEHNANGFVITDIKNPDAYVTYIRQLLDTPILRDQFGSRLRDKIKKEFSEESYDKQIKNMLKKVDYHS